MLNMTLQANLSNKIDDVFLGCTALGFFEYWNGWFLRLILKFIFQRHNYTIQSRDSLFLFHLRGLPALRSEYISVELLVGLHIQMYNMQFHKP